MDLMKSKINCIFARGLDSEEIDSKREIRGAIDIESGPSEERSKSLYFDFKSLRVSDILKDYNNTLTSLLEVYIVNINFHKGERMQLPLFIILFQVQDFLEFSIIFNLVIY